MPPAVSDSSVAVDEQRRHERLGLDRRQPEAIDEPVLVQPLDLVAEGEERVARNLADAVAGSLLERSATRRTARRRRSRSSCAMRSSGISRRISSTTLAIVALQQRHLQLVAVAAQVELLAEPDRAERVDAGAGGLAAAQQRQARAAAADFDQQRPAPP